MTQLTPIQAAQLAAQAGFSGQSLTDIVAIMGRESSYNPEAYNGNAATSDSSVGLAQINLYGDLAAPRIALLNSILPANQQVSTVQQAIAALKIPAINLKMAYLLSSKGTDFSPWKTNSNPNSFLDGTNVQEAQQAVSAIGATGSKGMGISMGDMSAAQDADQSYFGSGSFGDSVNAVGAALAKIPTGSPGGSISSSSWAQMQQTIQQFNTYLKAFNANPNDVGAAYALSGLGSLLSSEVNLIGSEGPSAQLRDALAALQQDLQTFQAQAAAQSSAASAYNTAQSNVTSRANTILSAEQAAIPWSANGKTTFTAGDLGTSPAVMHLLGQTPNSVVLQYPGTTLVNPSGLTSNIAAQQGVSGSLPPIGTNPNVQGQAGNALPFYNSIVGGPGGGLITGGGSGSPPPGTNTSKVAPPPTGNYTLSGANGAPVPSLLLPGIPPKIPSIFSTAVSGPVTVRGGTAPATPSPMGNSGLFTTVVPTGGLR